jgi:predicted double-glycine peptidase
LPKLKIPVIVLLNTRGYKHFVVLKGIKDGRAYLADPALGNRSVPAKEFVESWDGVAFVVFKKTDKEVALPLDTALKAPVSTVIGLKELGITNYIRLPGEF